MDFLQPGKGRGRQWPHPLSFQSLFEVAYFGNSNCHRRKVRVGKRKPHSRLRTGAVGASERSGNLSRAALLGRVVAMCGNGNLPLITRFWV